MSHGFLPSTETRMRRAVAMVRLYMRDYGHLNRLIEGEESDDRMIAWAILDTIEDFNVSPPHVGTFGIDNFPSTSLVREGAVARLLQSVSILATRNYINFSDGGTSVSFTANIPLIQRMSEMLMNSYEQKKMQLKVAMNIESGWGGGFHSDYALLGMGGLAGGFYGRW